jgi:hypothetical protein
MGRPRGECTCAGRKTCGRCVRGLLCLTCNTKVVPLVENGTLLNAALAYVARPIGDFGS